MKKENLGELVMDAAVLLVFLACMAFVYIGFKVLEMPDFVFYGVPVFFTLFEILCGFCVITWVVKIFSHSNWWRGKVRLLLLPFVGILLTGCSAFDSAPIEPEILGVGYMHYDKKSNKGVVVIDSTLYIVTEVTVADDNPYTLGVTQNMKTVDGMLVTVFTSSNLCGIQAVTGLQTVQQIEEIYHQNYTIALVVFFLFLVCVIGTVFICNKTEEESSETDKKLKQK